MKDLSAGFFFFEYFGYDRLLELLISDEFYSDFKLVKGLFLIFGLHR